MRYGHFDDPAREYVIERPDTPKSWINYLGSKAYGGIITQNAGGYSFWRSSGGTSRILRMRFNGVPADQPGRYVYLRDDATGDFWSASWQPVGKPLGRYQATVRHGLGYTVFESVWDGIRSRLTCYVPLDQSHEVWALEVENQGRRPRRLSVFSYAELANNWNWLQDIGNLQYSQYTVRMAFCDGIIHYRNALNPGWDELWFGLAGAQVEGFDTDRDLFLGPYRTPAQPLAVEKGLLRGSLAVGDNACASLHAVLNVGGRESANLRFVLGMGSPDESWRGLPPGRSTVAGHATAEQSVGELDELRASWNQVLDTFQVQTPDSGFDGMVNIWNAYQTHMTFNWSRGISLVEIGGRDGLGFRDTVQDMLAVVHSVPDAVEERLAFILTAQCACGGALPLVHPLSHRPGQEKSLLDEEYRSDDTLWLPLTVRAFVLETGRSEFLTRVLPYADTGSDTIFGHLKQAIQFGIDHKGRNGLLQGLKADWNDCIRFGSAGESLFTSFLFVHACDQVADCALLLGREDDRQWAVSQGDEVRRAIRMHAWDGAWFLRGIAATGGTLGSRRNPEGSIYLNPQSWAVLSGSATQEQALRCLDAVDEHLATEHGLLLCDPPHSNPDEHIELPLLVYPPGHKENAGIFCQANAWAVVAACRMGQGDRALRWYRSFLPSRMNEHADLRQVEPYVHCQFTHGRTSPRFGQSRNPWLTGTASWAWVAATQHILGIRPERVGLRVDPCIPASWKGFTVRRSFRGCMLEIEVRNPSGVSGGVSKLLVDGQEVQGHTVPLHLLRPQTRVEVDLTGLTSSPPSD